MEVFDESVICCCCSVERDCEFAGSVNVDIRLNLSKNVLFRFDDTGRDGGVNKGDDEFSLVTVGVTDDDIVLFESSIVWVVVIVIVLFDNNNEGDEAKYTVRVVMRSA